MLMTGDPYNTHTPAALTSFLHFLLGVVRPVIRLFCCFVLTVLLLGPSGTYFLVCEGSRM